MAQSIEDVLYERGSRYGVFMHQAQIAQSLHLVFEQGRELSGKNRFSFAPDQLEAIGMIFNKIGRITNGDPHYSDSWRDIAGYASLVADRLDGIPEQHLLESGNDGAGREIEADSGADEEPEVNSTTACDCDECDSRPTGQPELRRLPVSIEVQDGYHNNDSKVQ